MIEANLGPDSEDVFNINRITIKFYEVGHGDNIMPPLNNYIQIEPGKAVLRSLYSEISPKYGINCGKQTLPMCMTALAFNRLKPAANWSKADIDEILNKGDNLYLATMNEIQKDEARKLLELDKNIKTGDVENPNNVERMNSATSQDGKEDALDSEIFRIRSDNVRKEFNIGFNKFQLGFEDLKTGK